MSKKLATTIYITEQQQALLKELNRRTKVPIAEFIREGIDLVLEKHRSHLPGQMELQPLTTSGIDVLSGSGSNGSASGGR